jgi:hypothetical protein
MRCSIRSRRTGRQIAAQANGAPSRQAAGLGRRADKDAAIDDLKRKLDELQSQLAELSKKTPEPWPIRRPSLAARRVMSPCKSICIMDAKSNLCIGCKRTIDEIARWPMMTDDERARSSIR